MRIVIAGGGHASLVALGRLSRQPLPDGVELVLVSEAEEASYSGMVPGWVEGLYREDEVTIPVRPLVEAAGGRLVVDAVVGIDAARREVLLADGGPLSYDACVLNVGSRPQVPASGEASAVSLSVKPFRAFRERLSALFDALADGRPRAIAVVGGGVAGVELSLALCARARREDFSLVLTLLEAGGTIVPGSPSAFRRRLERNLAESGIEVRTNARVEAVEADAVSLVDGGALPADVVVWATPGAPPAWLEGSGLALDARGFVATDESLASVGHPEVLAVGDVGTIVSDPRPKAGVFSVRAGPPLARQLHLLARGEVLPPVALQRAALVLASVGDRRAVGTRNGLVAEGGWVWRLKDRIDRAFVRGLSPGRGHRAVISPRYWEEDRRSGTDQVQ